VGVTRPRGRTSPTPWRGNRSVASVATAPPPPHAEPCDGEMSERLGNDIFVIRLS
jgi:hypothetical protein